MNTEIQIPELSVAEVALKYPQALEVLNKYRIDYCCGGKRTFQEACEKAGAPYDEVWEQITKNDIETGLPVNFKKWSPSLLVDYILDQHHTYVKEAIPLLNELLDKVCDVHGKAYPELAEVRKSFSILSDELNEHMLKEERILFPAIKKMEQQEQPFLLDGPLEVMMDEHEAAGNLIKQIRSYTSNYTLPNDVCTTYRMTYQKLEAFDNDLMHHIHLENNILFEKVKQGVQ
ncbi:MAG TPA: iron-sulfur cluster repair di-iron protein [Cytophagales bacterium]|nr:iron-sulfur cluster repair di-iron protein [Cytophagales bacterium]